MLSSDITTILKYNHSRHTNKTEKTNLVTGAPKRGALKS